MKVSSLYRFYQAYLAAGKSKWLSGISAQQRLALLQQATQWQIEEMPEDAYRHWI
ncbi:MULTISPECIES: glucose uptake inhibitor SgrT [unclassified Brenneria]|uniref:glucose uptake inhibitor SgrT n=1 Tax=unclassified Brenneria TaxID=2634434 RepID=UPI0029C322E0|nr:MULTISPECIES: glucose uptake inhibitor SgrT [unclassified Brenneria]MDX5628953.1 glucose uptake inhibitor SgrT [Brenneria sp. L3-3Z]MDX5696092.1 glucose uptake inhibitor SgrT [Brenneria sp. L4-2C]